MMSPLIVLTFALAQAEPLGPGDHHRTLTAGGLTRSYTVHVPPGYRPDRPMPVVLALHGAAMNGKLMAFFSGLSAKADEAGFVVVYPNGTGPGNLILTWNAGPFFDLSKKSPDDVAFLTDVLDDVARILSVDPRRVYATGMSNGAMMAYRLAAMRADRIAAIAPVAGTLAVTDIKPSRPVPVIHFHGTKDTLVPFDGPTAETARLLRFLSVEQTARTWAKLNGCAAEPTVTDLPTPVDKLQVTRKSYDHCKDGAEVVVYIIEGGGHTWPGRQYHARFLGASTENIRANDLIWEFFQRHALPR